MTSLADSYDAVIIGAGLGGLAAAVTLASAGRKVRLLEQHRQVGGYATTFTRGPFEFEASLHELSGIGENGSRGGLWRALEELGVSDAVLFAPVREFFRTVGPGLDLRLPFGRAQATAALCEAFPEEARGIQRVHDHFYAIRSEIDRMDSRGGKPGMLSVVARYPRLAHAATVPLASILGLSQGCFVPPPLEREADGSTNRPFVILRDATAPPIGKVFTLLQGEEKTLNIALNDPDTSSLHARAFVDSVRDEVVASSSPIGCTGRCAAVFGSRWCDEVVEFDVVSPHLIEIYISDRQFVDTGTDATKTEAGANIEVVAWVYNCLASSGDGGI